jgi:NAD(P)-dependent dehydrogenase (short-subunit alcohol dehydrogenase family)
MGELDGKVAIVTGASRGIGRATAILLAREGAAVACAARTVNEGDHPLAGSLHSTVEAIRAEGGRAEAIAVDVSSAEECRRLVEETRQRLGPCDVLVNNAALTYFIPVEEFPERRWLRSFAVNVHAPVWLSQAVLPDMKAKGSGRIINVSSGAAIGPGRGPYANPRRGGTCYGMEKAALERFSQGLAEEVWPYGIGVAAVSPSQVVVTPGTEYHHLVSGPDDPRAEPVDYMARAIYLLAVAPLEEMAGLVTYSQALLKEYRLLENAQGLGVDRPGSGYSQR